MQKSKDSFKDCFENVNIPYVVAGTSDKKAVYNMWGSLFQWANEGRPMIDDNNKPTIYAHPYNYVFGKVLKKELRKSESSNI